MSVETIGAVAVIFVFGFMFFCISRKNKKNQKCSTNIEQNGTGGPKEYNFEGKEYWVEIQEKINTAALHSMQPASEEELVAVLTAAAVMALEDSGRIPESNEIAAVLAAAVAAFTDGEVSVHLTEEAEEKSGYMARTVRKSGKRRNASSGYEVSGRRTAGKWSRRR